MGGKGNKFSTFQCKTYKYFKKLYKDFLRKKLYIPDTNEKIKNISEFLKLISTM